METDPPTPPRGPCRRGSAGTPPDHQLLRRLSSSRTARAEAALDPSPESIPGSGQARQARSVDRDGDVAEAGDVGHADALKGAVVDVEAGPAGEELAERDA